MRYGSGHGYRRWRSVDHLERKDISITILHRRRDLGPQNLLYARRNVKCLAVHHFSLNDSGTVNLAFHLKLY